MSHFSVLVITDNKPSQQDLEAIMVPWHEFECTGYDNEYVIDVDITKEIENVYNEKILAIKHGTLIFDRFDDSFYETDTDWGSRKNFKLPEGAEEVELTAEEARACGLGRATMKDAAEYYYGKEVAFEKDGRWYRKTNPSKKWDWWQVGGRWTGLLVPHYDPDKDPDNIETCIHCNGTGKRNDSFVQGTCNACDGKGKSPKWPTARKRIEGDQMRWGDVPIIPLRDEAEREALKTYDKAIAIIAGREIPVWDEIRERHSPNAARTEYNDNPVVKDLNKEFRFIKNIEQFKKSRTECAQKARANALVTFAVVKDGKWYERGSMGWWACVSNEKSDWASEFEKLLDGLSPDAWISVIDCHI